MSRPARGDSVIRGQRTARGPPGIKGSASPDASVLHNGKKSLAPRAVFPRTATSGSRRGGSLRARQSDHRKNLRTNRLGAHRRSHCSRSRPLTHRIRRGAHHGLHAFRCPLRLAWRNTRLDTALPSLRGHPLLAIRSCSQPANRRFPFKARQPGSKGVSLDEASPQDSPPTRDAVKTFGPAYRYPCGRLDRTCTSKVSLYDRGYQHGYSEWRRRSPNTRNVLRLDLALARPVLLAISWNTYRTTANALFLRGFDGEILEEMRGIADGANAAGAKWLDRKIDLIDINVANTDGGDEAAV